MPASASRTGGVTAQRQVTFWVVLAGSPIFVPSTGSRMKTWLHAVELGVKKASRRPSWANALIAWWGLACHRVCGRADATAVGAAAAASPSAASSMRIGVTVAPVC